MYAYLGPRFTELHADQSIEIYENTTQNTNVYDILAVDPDSGPSPLNYTSLVQTPYFVLNGSVLMTSSENELDAETVNIVKLQFR